MSLRRSARAKAPTIPEVSASAAHVNGVHVSNPPANARRRASKPAKAKPTQDQEAMPPPPSTPSRKRKRAELPSPAQPPPFTPTPSAIGVMTAPDTIADHDKPDSPLGKVPRVRPAGPHMTNAPLQTPKGSKIVADPLASATVATTTDNLLEKANAHLIAVDPKLATVISQNHCKLFSPEGLRESIDPFRSLVSGICGQQVSGAAARSIKNKFVGLYNEGVEGDHVWPTPEQVAATDITRLRTAGLSQRKAEYIQGLAQKFVDGELSAQLLAEGSDEELLEKLVSVRGLGRWSAEMFLTFCLKRMDILSTGDLGVQRGMAAYAGKDVAKLKAKGGGKWKYMSEQDMLDISAKFSPYRSLFMWYMWRIENVDVDVMQDA